jgi:ABC-2 type transport system permease protein
MTNIPEISLDAQSAAATPLAEPRPFYWSVRRELWENRSIIIAPMTVAGFVMFGFFISLFSLAKRTRAAMVLEPMRQRALMMKPFDVGASLLIFVGLFVAFFYCLDALYGERRDRSILFWQSLPVSDRITVLSKAVIPLAVIPALSFVLALAMQLVMLIVSSMVLAANGISPSVLWGQLHIVQETIVMLYGIAAVTLWSAPLYAWLMLLSGWAKRAVIVWAALPFIVLAAIGGQHARDFVRYRLVGWWVEGFRFPAHGLAPLQPFDAITPLRFFSSGGLWGGLVAAALLITVVVRYRREREPI